MQTQRVNQLAPIGVLAQPHPVGRIIIPCVEVIQPRLRVELLAGVAVATDGLELGLEDAVLVVVDLRGGVAVEIGQVGQAAQAVGVGPVDIAGKAAGRVGQPLDLGDAAVGPVVVGGGRGGGAADGLAFGIGDRIKPVIQVRDNGRIGNCSDTPQ